METSDSSRSWHCGLAGQDTCHLQGPYTAISITLGSREDKGREMDSPLPPCQPVGWGPPSFVGLSSCPSCCHLFGTLVTGNGATRGSQGTLQRQVALMGILPLSLPAISQEPGSSWQTLGELHREKVLNLQQTPGDRRWLCQRVTGHSGAGQCCWYGREHPGGRAAPSLQADAWQQDSAARLRGALNPARGTVSRQPAVS